MKELDSELWKYGIPAKTKHNEAAPAQHEIACIYRKVNITTDNNHLIMQLMQDIAKKHGLRCLLHEKPFRGVNGSGKHNNWSVVTNTGINLFKPGTDPINNKAFLATLACMVKGVDDFADLLRLSIATPGNDHRLGGNEAPPATISMFLGEELNDVIEAIINDKAPHELKNARFNTGVSVIPDFKKDNTDRNRTSPFAFTGNKFEFRGVGSSQSIAVANTMLNSMLAATMKKMIEKLSSGLSLNDCIKEFFNNHKRVIFEGNGYSKEWEDEVSKRGLSNLKNTVDAIKVLKNKKLTTSLVELGVFTNLEVDSRYEILLDSYSKTIQVEASTALYMAKSQIFPACISYYDKIINTTKTALDLKLPCNFIMKDVSTLGQLLGDMKDAMDVLENNIKEAQSIKNDCLLAATTWKDKVVKAMNDLRVIVDTLETKVDEKTWPMPTYIDLLFGIK